MTTKQVWKQNLISRIITTLFILPIPIPVMAAQLPTVANMDSCMASVEFSENFAEYQADLNDCYTK
jgi:hypothetical protein